MGDHKISGVGERVGGMGEGYSRGLEPLGQLRWLAYDEASWELRGLAIEYREGRGGAELVELVEEVVFNLCQLAVDFSALGAPIAVGSFSRLAGHAFVKHCKHTARATRLQHSPTHPKCQGRQPPAMHNHGWTEWLRCLQESRYQRTIKGESDRKGGTYKSMERERGERGKEQNKKGKGKGKGTGIGIGI